MATSVKKFCTRMCVSAVLRTTRILLRLHKLHVMSVSWGSFPGQECVLLLRSAEQQLRLSLTIQGQSPAFGSALRRLPLEDSAIALLSELSQRGTQLTLSEIRMHFQL